MLVRHLKNRIGRPEIHQRHSAQQREHLLDGSRTIRQQHAHPLRAPRIDLSREQERIDRFLLEIEDGIPIEIVQRGSQQSARADRQVIIEQNDRR